MAASKASIADKGKKLSPGWLMILGIGMVLLGTAAMVVPAAFTLATSLVLGWVLVVLGAMQVLSLFHSKAKGETIWALITGVLGLAAGLVLLIKPLPGILTLTLLLALFLIAEGVVKAMWGFRLRPEPGWGWLVLSGLLALLLGVLIYSKWPWDAVWVIGLMVGIDLLFTGWSVIAMSLALKRQRAQA